MKKRVPKIGVLILILAVEVVSASLIQLKKKCEEGDGKSCTEMGKILSEKEGKEMNFSKVIYFFKRGCNLGDAEGCYNTALMYGKGKEAINHYPQIFFYLKRGCKLGDKRSCFLYRNLQ